MKSKHQCASEGKYALARLKIIFHQNVVVVKGRATQIPKCLTMPPGEFRPRRYLIYTFEIRRLYKFVTDTRQRRDSIIMKMFNSLFQYVNHMYLFILGKNTLYRKLLKSMRGKG